MLNMEKGHTMLAYINLYVRESLTAVAWAIVTLVVMTIIIAAVYSMDVGACIIASVCTVATGGAVIGHD